MSITGFHQCDEAIIETAASANARREEIERDYGSVENYINECETVFVCSDDERQAMAAYYAGHPESLGDDWYEFADQVLAGDLTVLQGDDVTKAEFVKALNSVAEKCKIYHGANEKNFPLQDSEGISFEDALEIEAHGNFIPEVTGAFGGKSRSDTILLWHPDTKEVVGAANFRAIVSAEGGLTVSDVFFLIERPFRNLDTLARFHIARDTAALTYFSTEAKDALQKQGSFYVIGEVNQPQHMTLGEFLEDTAFGTKPTARPIILRRMLGLAQIDTGKVPFVYLPYGDVPPNEYLVPVCYERQVIHNDDDQFALCEVTDEHALPGRIFLGHHRNIAAYVVGDSDPVAFDESGTAREQLGHYERVAQAGGSFPIVPLEATVDAMRLWDLRVEALRNIFGSGDLSGVEVYVHSEDRLYSPLGFTAGKSKGGEGKLSLEKLYNNASFEGVPLKWSVDDQVKMMMRPRPGRPAHAGSARAAPEA